MTSPKNARKTSAGRLYEWSRGAGLQRETERYWSVTTIIGGAIPKPALVGWAAKFVAEYAVVNHHRVGKLLEAVQLDKSTGVFSDPGAVQGAIDWLKGSTYRERDRKGDLGTTVHEHAEAYMKRKPFPEAMGDAVPYVEQFHRFLEEWEPQYEMAEQSVYNRTLKYAGTLDAICVLPKLAKDMELNPSRVILDYKTTGSGVYPEAALQLAAYRFSEFIGSPDGEEVPMPAVDGAAVVWLRPDGYDVIPVVADETVFKSFRYAIEIFRWAEEISKNVIGQPLPTPKKEAV